MANELKPETGFTLPDGSMLIWNANKRNWRIVDPPVQTFKCTATELLDLINEFADDASERAVQDYAEG